MRPTFRYQDEDWPAIDACLMFVGQRSPTRPAADAHVQVYYRDAHIQAYYRHTLEAIVHRFLWMTERFDPRSPEVIATTSLMAEIAEHSQAMHAAFTKMEKLETEPFRSIGYAIAAKPNTLYVWAFDWVRGEPLEPLVDDYTPHADYLAFKAKNAAVALWATTAAHGWPKSLRTKRDASGQPSRPLTTVAGPNQSRGDDVDKLIDDLLRFWKDRGGKVSKGSESPSTRFVMAAVGQITIPGVVNLRHAIVDFVRDQTLRLDPQK
jgi:hypothetical protein